MANARRFRFDGEERFHRAFSAFESALEEARASGDYTQAQLYLDKACAIQAQANRVALELARAYLRSGGSEELRAELVKAEELNERLIGILKKLGEEVVEGSVEEAPESA